LQLPFLNKKEIPARIVELSVVMPIYNERNTLRSVAERVPLVPL